MEFLFGAKPTSGILFRQIDDSGKYYIILKATSIGSGQYELNDFYGLIPPGIDKANAAAQAAYNETCGLSMVNGQQLAQASINQPHIKTAAKIKIGNDEQQYEYSYQLLSKIDGNETVYWIQDNSEPVGGIHVLSNENYKKIQDATSLPIIGSFNSSKLVFISDEQFGEAMSLEVQNKPQAGFARNVVYTAIDGPNAYQLIDGNCRFSNRLRKIIKKLGEEVLKVAQS